MAESVAYRIITTTMDWIDHRHGFITAVSTFFIGLFTFTLWRSTRGMLRATNEAIKLTREELIATHRPKVVMRRLFLEPSEAAKPVCIRYDLANIGGTAAYIVFFEWKLTVLSHSKIVDFVEHHEETNNLKDALRIRAGEAIGSFIRGKASLTQDDIDEIEKSTDTAGIHIVGVLAYRDQLGTKRRTAFWRRYEPSKNGRFAAADDQDLEYAD
jgi:hypothetical protein